MPGYQVATKVELSKRTRMYVHKCLVEIGQHDPEDTDDIRIRRICLTLLKVAHRIEVAQDLTEALEDTFHLQLHLRGDPKEEV